jgi:mannose-6-phosphate isomerase-like protein (cupin superfamily)
LHVHISAVSPEEVAPGVLERMLLRPEQSATMELWVSHYTITDGEMRFEGADIEYQHYIISGCCFWRNQLVHSESALFVPASRNPHTIRNLGEGELRVITHAYKLPRPNFKWAKAGSAHLYEVKKNLSAQMAHQQLFTEAEHALLGAMRSHALDVQTHPPHGVNPVHRNPEETMYFLRGTGEAVSEDVRFKVRPGSFVYTPEGKTMGIFNTHTVYPLQYLCMEFMEQDKGWSARGYQGSI